MKLICLNIISIPTNHLFTLDAARALQVHKLAPPPPRPPYTSFLLKLLMSIRFNSVYVTFGAPFTVGKNALQRRICKDEGQMQTISSLVLLHFTLTGFNLIYFEKSTYKKMRDQANVPVGNYMKLINIMVYTNGFALQLDCFAFRLPHLGSMEQYRGSYPRYKSILPLSSLLDDHCCSIIRPSSRRQVIISTRQRR